MPNKSTYAYLIKPRQFKPDEEIIIRVETSEDLMGSYATLKIYGYDIHYSKGEEYNGLTMTKWHGEGDTMRGILEFIIPPNTLARNPDGVISYAGGKGVAKAVVEFGSTLGDDGNVIPQFRSNTISLDIIISWGDMVIIKGAPLIATCSTKNILIHFNVHESVIGSPGSEEVNSYQVLLYDKDYNLINDSGTIPKWSASNVLGQAYKLENLKDNTNYYVKAKATLEGGYVASSDFAPLSVRYSDTPTFSENLILSNDRINGKVDIEVITDVEHDKVIISRCEQDTDDYLEIKKFMTNNNVINLQDYYALPNVTYIYKAIIMNGNDVVCTYYNSITHKIDGVCIADSYGHYSTIIYTQKYPVNKNDRATLLETMDSTYPYAIVNGSLNYDSGSVSVTFTEADSCSIVIEDNTNVNYVKGIRHWLNNGRAKFLKYDNGECWLVSVSSVSDESIDNSDILATTFSWTEIGNAKDNSEFIRLGLVMPNE